jgi:hypothetical protein
MKGPGGCARSFARPFVSGVGCLLAYSFVFLFVCVFVCLCVCASCCVFLLQPFEFYALEVPALSPLGPPLPTSAPRLVSPLPHRRRNCSPLPHLHRTWAHPCHSCTGWARRCQGWAHSCYICTKLGQAATSAPGPGSPVHVCTGTGLTPAHICARLGQAATSAICAGTALALITLRRDLLLPHLHRGLPLAHLLRDSAHPAHMQQDWVNPLPRLPLDFDVICRCS